MGPTWCFIVFPTMRWSCFRGRSWWHFPFWPKFPDSQILFFWGPHLKKTWKFGDLSNRTSMVSQILVGGPKGRAYIIYDSFGFVWQPIPADVQHPRPYGSPPESCVAGHNMAFRIVRPMGPPPQAVFEEEMRIFGTNIYIMYKPFPRSVEFSGTPKDMGPL